MKVAYLKLYDQSFLKLTKIEQEKTVEAINKLIDTIRGEKKPEGLGLKKIKNDYWEIRINLSKRIVFKIEPQILIIAFVGSHEEVRRFLKSR